MISASPDGMPYWCFVCGAAAMVETGDDRPAGNLMRCEKHASRNPCIVEGCKRSIEAPVHHGQLHLSNDDAICGDHWRRYVPPRSPERRLYHRHFRRAKRLGWNRDRLYAFEVFWRRLVARVRQRAQEGYMDEAAINRLFGWGDEDSR